MNLEYALWRYLSTTRCAHCTELTWRLNLLPRPMKSSSCCTLVQSGFKQNPLWESCTKLKTMWCKLCAFGITSQNLFPCRLAMIASLLYLRRKRSPSSPIWRASVGESQAGPEYIIRMHSLMDWAASPAMRSVSSCHCSETNFASIHAMRDVDKSPLCQLPDGNCVVETQFSNSFVIRWQCAWRPVCLQNERYCVLKDSNLASTVASFSQELSTARMELK